MKLSFITEATIQQIKNRIPMIIDKYKLTQQDLQLLPTIVEPDPTSGRYSDWLVKNYKDGTTKVPEDNDKLKDNLTQFHRKRAKLQNKDLNSYTPKSLTQALEEVLGLTKSERKSARRGKLQLPPGAKIIGEDGDLTVVEITTPEASSILCSGTKWCTANELTAKYRLEQGPLYLLYENGERKYLVQYEALEFMNTGNTEVVDKVRYEYLFKIEPFINKLYRSEWAIEYARDVIKGRWPEAEPIIMKNPKHASYYARDVIKGRWPEAEPIIMKDSEHASYYARDVIKGRWPEAEPIIMKDPSAACLYAEDVIKGRWPEAEPIIMKDPSAAYYYARDVIKGRWPEAEPIIMKNPKYAFNYAYEVIKGRWPEAEPIIMEYPSWAGRYATALIRGRWPEAEPIIMKDSEHASYYARDVIKGRWPEAEPIIMKDPSAAYYYARDVIKGRWPEAEPIIMKNPEIARLYAEVKKRQS